MFQPYGRDPLTTSWMLVLVALFILAVAVPMLRLVIALALHAYAALSGRRHLHVMAARVMPRTAQLIGGVIVGVASIAAPALAANDEPALASINLDRDAGASAGQAAAPSHAGTPSHAVPANRASTSTHDGAQALATTATHAPAVRADLVPGINLDRDGGASSTTVSPSRTTERVSRSASTTADAIYIVRTGDSLWKIAAAHLDEPTEREITEGWKALWRANRAVIGDHPELIHPGQRLMLPPGALA